MKQLIFILAVALAFAASAPGSAITFENIQHSVEIYNSGVENAPGVVKTLLGDERVQVEISRANGTALMAGLETKNAVIVRAIPGEIEDPTIVVEGKEEAITRVYQSDDPVAAFQEAKDQGEISVRGTTFTSKLKVTAALASTPALRFFASLIGK
jgi:pectin methylesterase-like acyl-CoA thioesterase